MRLPTSSREKVVETNGPRLQVHFSCFLDQITFMHVFCLLQLSACECRANLHPSMSQHLQWKSLVQSDRQLETAYENGELGLHA